MSKLYIVPTPIGNLNDMTTRAIEALKESNLILAEDTRHTQNLLNVFEIKTKLISYHKFNEKKRSEEIIEEILINDKIVSIVTDAGTPCISDPGYEIVKLARENNIEVIGLAGACATTIALSVSGINTDRFSFYGFLPRKDKELEEALEEVKQNLIKTYVIYESPKRIKNLLNCINKVMPNAQLCVCKELTKLHERITYGTVSEVKEIIENDENAERGEYAIIGFNNDFVEKDESGFKVSLEALIFDKIYSKQYSLKDAVKEIVEEKNASKNDAYKASLNVKEFFESNVFSN
ncbi:16S rRNA (cytidine(1402)-2'-O)-methyltransferase [Sedimentibacter sp. zth1]|uniref:16S rRNA (cytidine(1402)-2'-O)-methyltransferase n=1 Tax=Sedimentibacter sp. zth1 TaxID=2816908 RepID=UPI001A916F23|nr:16S rRNA (cytidine(1402)-2'-O)-methyltransferase [Sedimentibacter sp. zth1]QSX07006.1 16S rRNA (cytidine(1402)-2'-O)-methyltransferase [Sedimentibacter sp. zth1]